MQKKKHNRQKDILFVLISSFVVVVAWIGFHLYHITVTSTISAETQAKLTPIDNSFDITTLQSLKSREQIVPAFERESPASQSAPVIPTPTATVPAPTEPVPTVQADTSRFAPTDAPIIRTGQ